MRAIHWEHAEAGGHRALTTLSLFSAVTAIGGAAELLFDGDGRFAPPLRLLRYTPFTSFVIPALLLGVVVGGSSLVSALLTWRGSKRAADAQLVAGGALTVWIVAESAMTRIVHPLQLGYGLLGVVLLAFGVTDAWRSRQAHLRWLICVTPLEAAGFLVPMVTGILTRNVGLVIVAGLAEGFALGLGQALGFPFPVRRWRYAVLSAVGGCLSWLCILGGMRWHAYALMPFGLIALGGLQSLALERHRLRWIGWTALAWIVALPLSFLPMPFVDETTPLPAMLALWACGGLLMAYAMAWVTWAGARPS